MSINFSRGLSDEKGVFLAPLIRGVQEHQQKVSVQTEEGEWRVSTLWNGVKRVALLSLESIVVWPLFSIALLVEYLFDLVMFAFISDQLLPDGCDFIERHVQYFVRSIKNLVRFSIIEAVRLFQYFVESQANVPEKVDVGTMTDRG